MTDALIKHMVDRFLYWRLPADFHPDCGISFDAEAGKKLNPRNVLYEPVGTNLFTATQAEAMVRFMVEGLALPQLQQALVPVSGGEDVVLRMARAMYDDDAKLEGKPPVGDDEFARMAKRESFILFYVRRARAAIAAMPGSKEEETTAFNQALELCLGYMSAHVSANIIHKARDSLRRNEALSKE